MQIPRKSKIFTASVSASLALSSAWALEIPAIFNSGMVLQRETPVTVWGWTAAATGVKVTFAGQSHAATADPDGRWEVVLDPLPASAQPRTLVVSSEDGAARTFEDVVVGDVWILAGQSNMGWPLRDCDGGAEAAATADFPWLRVFHQSPHAGAADEPARDVHGGKWITCRPQNAGHISGVGFFFARALHETVDVPIGLVHTAMGGTAIQCWIDASTLRSMPEAVRYLKWEEESRRTHDEDEKEWTRLQDELENLRNEARLRGEPPPAKLTGRLANGPPLGEDMFRRHSALFNGKVAPLQPFAARGIIWYQGEGNTMEAEAYGPLLQALIGRWREGWRDPKLPFLVVQLPRFRTESNWAGVRAAQEAVARQHEGVSLAVTIDLGNEDNIHPGDKLPVGERLALLARKEILGEPQLPARSPTVDSLRRRDDFVDVRFALDGTKLRQPETNLRGFAWVGANGQKYPTTARIIGPDLVEVSAPAEASAIAYADEAWPEVSLFDEAGLPAAPFLLPINPS
jgi:sialate O-acetylesterase